MKLYKHPRNTDVAFMKLRHIEFQDDDVVTHKLKVSWFNIVNPSNVFPMNVTEELVLTDEKYKEFELYA